MEAAEAASAAALAAADLEAEASVEASAEVTGDTITDITIIIISDRVLAVGSSDRAFTDMEEVALADFSE